MKAPGVRLEFNGAFEARCPKCGYLFRWPWGEQASLTCACGRWYKLELTKVSSPAGTRMWIRARLKTDPF